MKICCPIVIVFIISVFSQMSFAGEAEITLKNRTGLSVEREMKESGEKGGTQDINIGVGELQECAGAANKDARCKGSAAQSADKTKQKNRRVEMAVEFE